jgi:GT2 family glycosyltransferase
MVMSASAPHPVSATDTPGPTVLAVIVASDGAARWLPGCLRSLAQQSYPRLGVLAVDDASTDGSEELLLRALGERRVVRAADRRGYAASVRDALGLPAARDADFVLLVDPRAALDPDAVARLVEAAVGIGVEQVGIVGAKVVDLDQPRLLRDIGRSADRFGHPYSPLAPDEIDQGQFDRVLEVLCVSSSTMLVARDAWERTGMFDERLDPLDANLDLCWRARLAGFRVLMTPLARVRVATAEARPRDPGRGRRYEEDRAAVAAMLKNYGVVSLLWILPLAFALGVVRLAFLLLGRRFEEAFDLAAAWGWNLAHLPGTLARRRRAQRARTVPDRSLRRFMESAGLRLPRWFATAERIIEEQRAIDEADEGEPIRRRLRDRTASLVGSHPVIVASFVAIVVGVVATRDLVGTPSLVGGALPSFPSSAGGFFAELAAAARSTPLGGSLAPTPALGAIGALATALFGDPDLAQKALLLLGPPLAATLLYRAAVRTGARPGPAVVAAASYGLSAFVLWAFSEGRIGTILGAAILPAALERIDRAFARAEPLDGRPRFVAGLAVTFAVGTAFFPGILLAITASVLVRAISGPARGRGLVLCGLGAVGAAVLLFPFVPTVFADGGRALGSLVGTTEVDRLVRLALGGGPGTWTVALFLPIAAAISFGLVRGELRAPAGRAAASGSVAIVLAWLSAADRLPTALANPSAYAALAAVAMATLVALGLTSSLGSMRLEAFGVRQIAVATTVIVLAAGISLQAMASMVGTWGIGDADRIPAAWAVLNGSVAGSFRVLWLEGDVGAALPPPAGDPQRRLEAGAATIRYALTDRQGATILDLGRPLTGPGPDRLDASLDEILSGTTSHGGALLAPFGIRFVVADDALLPPATRAAFDAQLDLDQRSSVGLTIWRNAAAIPPAAVLDAEPADEGILQASDLDAIARWRSVPSLPLETVDGGWDGPPASGTVSVATEFDPGWRLEGSDAPARPAFGWATSFPADGDAIRVRHGGGLGAGLRVALLAILWAAALWVTRRPVTR